MRFRGGQIIPESMAVLHKQTGSVGLTNTLYRTAPIVISNWARGLFSRWLSLYNRFSAFPPSSIYYQFHITGACIAVPYERFISGRGPGRVKVNSVGYELQQYSREITIPFDSMNYIPLPSSLII